MTLNTSKRCRSTSPTPSFPKRVQIEMPSSCSKVRFLILSDTHGADLPSDLSPCDVVLHCGDLTEDGSPKSIAQALEALSKIEAEVKLVIAGNHAISMDRSFYLAEGGTKQTWKKHIRSYAQGRFQRPVSAESHFSLKGHIASRFLLELLPAYTRRRILRAWCFSLPVPVK